MSQSSKSAPTPGQSVAQQSAVPGFPPHDFKAWGVASLHPGVVVRVVVWLLLILCCVLPIGWIALQLTANSTAWAEFRIDAFRARLLLRTIGYNAIVAILATLVSVPVAVTLGRGRGWTARLLWFIVPIALLLPSLAVEYAWKQLLRLCHLEFEPAGFADVGRCIWTLSAWLWPIPAMLMGLALRRADPSTQMQALLDGAQVRTMLRQLLAPAIAGACIVMALALQEFSVYEPTGISVVATEVRMVFETGAFSSELNPIIQPMTGQISTPQTLPNQDARAAAAVAVSAPLLLLIGTLAVIGTISTRKLATSETVSHGSWPRLLDAGTGAHLAAVSVVFLAVVAPIVALLLSLKRGFDPARVLAEFGPHIAGSFLGAAIASVMAAVIAIGTATGRIRGAMLVTLSCFLIGGQLIAIALIRLYNRPAMAWIHDTIAIAVIAYIARFGWIAVVAGGVTWSRQWREMRDLAATDGANPLQTARYVVLPLAWPLIVAGALLVAALSLTEVPATVLLSPQRPQILVPLLMSWVHMARYDAMIEACLVMVGMVAVLGVIAIGMIAWSKNMRPMGNVKIANYKSLHVVCILALATSLGCDRQSEPKAVWGETGGGAGQLIYPRAIAYSSADDTFFVCDRAARVQHLSRDGAFINEWRMPEFQQGKPVGLTVGPDGNLYVPDTHYHRVMVYKPDGTGPIKQWGGKGTAPGQFIYPTDVAFDSKGNIFVSEYGDNDRIQVFDRDAKFLYSFGKFGDGDGEFSRPQSMVIDHETMYITDACNHRIVVFKTDGTFVRNIGKVGSGPGEFRFPYGLAMDGEGKLIVCEFGNNRVQKIDVATGNGLGEWGGAGREPGKLAYPWGVAVDKRGRIIAVDAGNNRLQVFTF